MCNSVSAPFGNSGYYRLFPLHRAEGSQCTPWLCPMSSLSRVGVLDQDSFIFLLVELCVLLAVIVGPAFDCGCCWTCARPWTLCPAVVCSLTRQLWKAGFKHAGQGTADGRRNTASRDTQPPGAYQVRILSSTLGHRQKPYHAQDKRGNPPTHSEGIPRYLTPVPRWPPAHAEALLLTMSPMLAHPTAPCTVQRTPTLYLHHLLTPMLRSAICTLRPIRKYRAASTRCRYSYRGGAAPVDLLQMPHFFFTSYYLTLLHAPQYAFNLLPPAFSPLLHRSSFP